MKKHPFSQGRLWLVAATLGFFILLGLLAGCENGNTFNGLADENSKEARTEKALMAMDDGNYPRAVSLFTELAQKYPNDCGIAQYLSCALAGQAGLDTIDLLAIIDELDNTGESGSIDMIGLVVGDDLGRLTGEELTAKLADINAAIRALTQCVLDDADRTILLGLLSITRLSLTVGDIVFADQGGETLTITLTEDGLSDLYESILPDFSELEGTQTLDNISEDILNVDDAIDALDQITSDNNLAEDFEQFQNDLDPNHDGYVAYFELENYIINLIQG